MGALQQTKSLLPALVTTSSDPQLEHMYRFPVSLAMFSPSIDLGSLDEL